ncbi:zinc ABC transporter substrate-binding protein [Motiliproteus coralliicola]|uniref:High-affinity zinc uptake system protein ZnuA n=1 Tax=Motiliproteus coralliicola TaxID=2283196 RepID=A0A369WFW6_9GAMM|nr:zinc ABC transporter substrate-binding protein [Motiliproteus coralliicola]
MPHFSVAALLLTAVLSLISVQARALDVVATIQPIKLLVAEITDGVVEPKLLLPANTSPHDFQLKPSQRRTIQQADVIFWIGPDMEMALNKPLAQLDDHTLLVTLAEGALDSEKLHQEHDEHEAHEEHEAHQDHDEHKENDAHDEEHDHDEHEAHKEHAEHEENDHDDHAQEAASHEHGHDHEHGEDLHLWLDPHEGERIAKLVAETLSQADPNNRPKYQQNLAEFLTDLEDLDKQLKQRLKPLSGKGYFVFHDAYNRFEAHYGLSHLGAITISPERSPGAKHAAEIRERLIKNEAVCVFSEPQFPSPLVSNLIEGTDVGSGVLDPMGGQIAQGPKGYLRFLEQMAADFEACLSQSNN